MHNDILWKKFISGDKNSLALIFRSFYEDLYNYGLKLTNSKNVTEDGMQDLFMKLWINRSRLPETKNLKAYLLTSLRNTLFDSLRWIKKQNLTEMTEENFFEIEFSTEDILIRDQVDTNTRNTLIRALNNLTSRQKEAIFLRFYEDLDFDVIASVMDVNVQSVRNFIHKGLSALKDADINSGKNNRK